MMETGVVVAIAIFMAGVIYQLGRFAARLEAMEGWRAEHRVEMDRLYAALREIRELCLGERGH